MADPQPPVPHDAIARPPATEGSSADSAGSVGASSGATATGSLDETPLADAHRALGARMVPFAGYLMPVQYEGVIAEHVHTRTHAGLFDISHMGQAVLVGPDHAITAAALEALAPGDVAGLALGRLRYTQLTNDAGGILDDLIVTRSISADDDGRLMIVVNASRKAADYAHIAAALPASVTLEPMPDRALIALQGPDAEAVLAAHTDAAKALAFMSGAPATIAGIDCHVSRSGYTGEDGFEISVAARDAVALWKTLLADQRVKPVGLGARDSLRLEAGLCLYGNDIDETTSPVEAGLGWSIGKRRRAEGGFPGAERIHDELADGPGRRRVAIRPTGRAPARGGTEIRSEGGHQTIGEVTSGGFGPTVGGPIAMGYVAASHAASGTPVELVVRGKALPAEIVPLPFVPHTYKR